MFFFFIACNDPADSSPTKESDSTEMAPRPQLIPAPAILEQSDGFFQINGSTTLSAASGTESVASQIAAELRAPTGLPLTIQNASSNTIKLVLSDDATPPEGYLLEVSPNGITLTAADLDGLYWGAQTLRQLLPPAALSPTPVSNVDWLVPAVHIEDAPRYPQRGLMIDVARHFFTVSQIERQIDVMALHKLNRLHMHLTDDQGWRIEIQSWPDLTTIGGSTQVGGGPGGFYTQADFLELVDYAAARHITVIPEIDFPGHANAALASYASLNENGIATSLYTGTAVISTPLWLEGPATPDFVADVWQEISALSPTGEVHIGGDEAVDISDTEYAAFLQGLQTTLTDDGAQITGWDEISGVGLSAPFTVQWWWHEGLIADAVSEGARVISSPANHAYFDMMYDYQGQFGQVWAGRVPLKAAWDWDPTPAGVDPSAVDGVEAALWTELIDSEEQMDFMLWPRAAALAEVGWSEPGGVWSDFAGRMRTDGLRLDAMGIGYYRTAEVLWE